MVKTMLPVQRNKDEYEFQDENNESGIRNSPPPVVNEEGKIAIYDTSKWRRKREIVSLTS